MTEFVLWWHYGFPDHHDEKTDRVLVVEAESAAAALRSVGRRAHGKVKIAKLSDFNEYEGTVFDRDPLISVKRIG